MSLAGSNEIGKLHRAAKRFCIPLSSEQREQAIAHLVSHRTVVVGGALLAFDCDESFKTSQNPMGAFIVGACEEILAAAGTADLAGIA